MHNKKPNLRFTARREQELFHFLMEMMHGISRNKVKAILQSGSVTVDGVVTQQFDAVVRVGAKVEVARKKPKQHFKSKWVNVLYEDKDIVVVDKAINILSMSPYNRLFSVKTVLDTYFQQKHQKCTAHVVHRLDRETSGVMVYAKTVEAQQILVDNWQEIVTDRRYVACVEGRMKGKGTVKSWIKDTESYISVSSPTDNGGKYAVTHYQVMDAKEDYSLVEFLLETGRKNQIRVHCQDLGHPIVGDLKYGNSENPMNRLALHAYRLCFYHPVTGYLMKFESPIPTSFRRMLASKKEHQEE